jgi:hypothetical protein
LSEPRDLAGSHADLSGQDSKTFGSGKRTLKSLFKLPIATHHFIPLKEDKYESAETILEINGHGSGNASVFRAV